MWRRVSWVVKVTVEKEDEFVEVVHGQAAPR